MDRLKKEQPVINSERQLSGKVVDEDTQGVLERSDPLTPEHLHNRRHLNAPETSLENES